MMPAVRHKPFARIRKFHLADGFTLANALCGTGALIAYGCGMQGLFDRIVGAYFVACGVSRLARYNITAEALSGNEGKVTHFEGTPIPTSLVLVLVMFVAATQGALREALWFGKLSIAGFSLHPLVLMFAVSGSLMVSRIRFPKP